MHSDSDYQPLEGESLTKNELKSRLNQMDIEFDNYVQKKNYYVDLYDKAVKNPQYRKKIQDKLNKDDQDRQDKKRKRPRDFSEDSAKELKVERKLAKTSDKEKVEVKYPPSVNVKSKKDIQSDIIIEEEKNAGSSYTIVETKTEEIQEIQGKDIHNINEFLMKEEIKINPTQTKIESPKRAGVTTTKISFSKPSNSASSLNTSSNSNLRPVIVNNVMTSIPTIPEEISSIQEQQPEITQIPTFTTQPFLSYPQTIQTNQPFKFQYNQPNQTQIPQVTNLTQTFGTPLNINNNEQILNNQIWSNNKHSAFELINPITNTSYKTAQNVVRQPSKTHSTNALINSKLHSQTNLPRIEGSEFNRVQNQVFTKEFESLKKLVSVPSSQRDLIRVDQERINGGISQEPTKITVSSIKTIPLISPKKINGLDKWENPENKNVISPKLIVKYFMAGLACSVMFYGLLYCIQNCPSISFEGLGMTSKFSVKDGLIPDKAKDTLTSNYINLNYDQLNDIGNTAESIYTEGLSGKIGGFTFPSFKDHFSTFFSNVGKGFDMLLNPKKFIWEYVIKNLGFMAIELMWGWFSRNIWYILGVITLKLIAYKAYQVYVNKSNSVNIYRDIKQRLRNMYDSQNPADGLYVDEIVRTYSNDYGMKEEFFRNTILPKLRDFRRADGEVREFDLLVNGRYRTLWQYVGFN